MSYTNIGKTESVIVSQYGGNFAFGAGDPAVTIMAAWTYLAGRGGGKIKLRGDGETWTTQIQIDSKGDNVILEGNGRYGPMLYLADSKDVDVIRVTHDNVVIQYVHVNGNWEHQTRDAGASQTATSRGIRFTQSDENVLQNGKVLYNYVEDVAWHGITMNQCESGLIHGNTVTNIGWNGIFAYRVSPSYGVIMSNNDVSHCGDVGMGMYGSRCQVVNNYIHDIDGTHGSGNTQWGAGIEGGDWNIIKDNVIDDVLIGIGTGFIADEDPQYWQIIGNTISGLTNASTGGHGLFIKARNGVVKNNTICDLPDWGLGGVYNVGIMIDDGATHIRVEGNTLSGATGYHGIVPYGEDDIWISNNLFLDDPEIAVKLRGACERIQVVGNTIFNGT